MFCEQSRTEQVDWNCWDLQPTETDFQDSSEQDKPVVFSSFDETRSAQLDIVREGEEGASC